MAAVPIYVWNGTAWQETGPTIPASPIKYQASAPSSPSTGDIWVDSDGDVTSGSTQLQRFRFVASGGETSLSGNDANGATLAYTAGMEQVVLNGAVLVRGHDYTATNGTSITGLSPALVANDVVEVFSFMAFNVANTYTQSQVDGLINTAAGLRLLTTQSFSAATSVTLPNNTFNATYRNYKIIIEVTSATAQEVMLLRMTNLGTPVTSASYDMNQIYLDPSNGATWFNDSSAANATNIRMAAATTAGGIIDFNVYNPFETKFTQVTGYNFSSTGGFYVSGGRVETSTSYDALQFYIGSGNMTGSYSVYGYNR